MSRSGKRFTADALYTFMLSFLSEMVARSGACDGKSLEDLIESVPCFTPDQLFDLDQEYVSMILKKSFTEQAAIQDFEQRAKMKYTYISPECDIKGIKTTGVTQTFWGFTIDSIGKIFGALASEGGIVGEDLQRFTQPLTQNQVLSVLERGCIQNGFERNTAKFKVFSLTCTANATL